jgi:predicted transcriptional regulator
VLRLMQVMHGKGLLLRDESQRSHVYAPAHPRESMRGNLLKDLIQKAYAGSGKELVMAALRGHVSAAERAEIQRFLEEKE